MRARLSMVRSQAGVSPQRVMTHTGQPSIFSSIIFAGHSLWRPRVLPDRTCAAENAWNPLVHRLGPSHVQMTRHHGDD
jgi:hypothetical protein